MARKSRRQTLDTTTMTYCDTNISENNVKENKSCVYARLSIADNGIENSTSLENQINYVLSSIKNFENVNVLEIYTDNGFSGTDFKRDGWERLISDVKLGKINCIIVKDLSRFGRNSIEAGEYLEKVFPFLGVRFISINDNFDSERDEYSRKMIENAFKNLMNEFYARDISKKSKAGIDARRSLGYITMARVGYGYKKSEDNKRVVLDENTADVVIKIFKWRRNGKTMGEIANILNTLAIPSPGKYLYMQSGGTSFKNLANSKWFTKNITDILSNRIYTGDLIQNKTYTNKFEGKDKVFNPKDEWIIVENAHTPLVSKEDFEYIQGLRKTITKRPKKINYLKNKVICGKCGYAMKKREVYSTRPSFNCQSNRTKLKELCGIAVSEKEIMETVRKMIQNFMNIYVNKVEVADKIRNSAKFKGIVTKRNNQISEENTSLIVIKNKIAGLYEDLKSGVITQAEFEYIKATYKNEYEKTEKRLKLLMKENKKVNDIKELNKKIDKLVSDVTKLDDDEFICSLVKTITVYPEKRLEVEFNFTDSFKELNEFISQWEVS